MKQKHFYAHLVEKTDITLELANLDMSNEERLHLLSLIDANIHSTVINTVLSNLPEEDKKIFLKNIVSDDHEKTWTHLKEKNKYIEEKIKAEIKNITAELLKDINEVKSKSA